MKKMRDLERQFRHAGLLLEYDDDGDDYEYFGGGGGSGGSSGSRSDLWKTFVQPLSDVWKTGEALVKSTISSLRMLSVVVIRSLFASMIPGLSEDFKEIFKADRDRQKAIAKKYSDVLKRNDEALFSTGGNFDGMGVISVLFPHVILTRNLISKAKSLSGPVLHSTLSAGLDMFDELSVGTTHNLTGGIRDVLSIRDNPEIDSKTKNEGSRIRLSMTSLNERRKDKTREEIMKDKAIKALDLLKDRLPAISDEISQSQQFEKMQEDGLNLLRDTTNSLATKCISVIEDINKIINASNIVGEIESFAKKYNNEKANTDLLNLKEKLLNKSISQDEKDEIIKNLKTTLRETIGTIVQGFIKATESYETKLITRAKALNASEEQVALIGQTIKDVPSYQRLMKFK